MFIFFYFDIEFQILPNAGNLFILIFMNAYTKLDGVFVFSETAGYISFGWGTNQKSMLITGPAYKRTANNV